MNTQTRRHKKEYTTMKTHERRTNNKTQHGMHKRRTQTQQKEDTHKRKHKQKEDTKKGGRK